MYKRRGHGIAGYAVMSVLLILIIGCMSGRLVSAGRILKSLETARDEYDTEDGHFELNDAADDTLITAFENEGIEVFPQFYKEVSEDKDMDGAAEAAARLFVKRDALNRPVLMEGTWPEGEGEAAIDRLHGLSAGIAVNDEILLLGKKYRVTGLAAFPDHSALYPDNTAEAPDPAGLDLVIVSEAGYAAEEAEEHYCYAFRYTESPDGDEKKAADDLQVKLRVLARSGGMTTDEAKALVFENNVSEWGGYLAETDEKTAELNERSEALKAKTEEIEQQKAPFKGESDELQKEASALQSSRDNLMKDIFAYFITHDKMRDYTELENNGNEMTPELVAMLPPDLKARAENMQRRSDELQEKYKALDGKMSFIQDGMDELKPETEAVEKGLAELAEAEEETEAIREKYEEIRVYAESRTLLTSFVSSAENKALNAAAEEIGRKTRVDTVVFFVFTALAALLGMLIIKTEGADKGFGIAAAAAVGFISCTAGNILGFTVFEKMAENGFYAEYALTPCISSFDAAVLIRTFLLPLLIIICVSTAALFLKRRFSDLDYMSLENDRPRRRRSVRGGRQQI